MSMLLTCIQNQHNWKMKPMLKFLESAVFIMACRGHLLWLQKMPSCIEVYQKMSLWLSSFMTSVNPFQMRLWDQFIIWAHKLAGGPTNLQSLIIYCLERSVSTLTIFVAEKSTNSHLSDEGRSDCETAHWLSTKECAVSYCR